MRWPSWLTWYKKPEYRDIKEYSAAVSSGKRSLSPNGRNGTIPSQLSVERVLENKTCSPMSLYDFYMYLKHMEHSEENLEFYIWYKEYERNYDVASDDKDDAPPCTSGSTSSDVKLNGEASSFTTTDVHVDSESAEQVVAHIAQLISSRATCTRGSKCKLTCAERLKASGNDGCKLPRYATSSTSTLTREAGYSKELQAIAQTFLVAGAPKELNIPPAMRSKALAGIKASGDPAHLGPIADHVFGLLRNCSHRNFVRLGVSNGTFETICVATGLGMAMTAGGFLAVLLLAFTPWQGFHSRWAVLGAWPLWWLGMSLILSGLRGSCFFLLLFSRRQPLPWERFTDAETGATERTGVLRVLSRLMIFDRKFRVKDVHLRHLQRKIVMQGLVGGAAFASCSVLLFIFLPVWRRGHAPDAGLGAAAGRVPAVRPHSGMLGGGS